MRTRVLVVDDDIEMINLMKIVLEPSTFDVLGAASGSEAIKLAQVENPDIIILDLLMPNMDGWQVCSQIREFSQVPILILSAINKPGMVAQALDAGADDYLIKPMPSGVLIAHIKKLVRRARAEQETNGSRVNYSM